MKNEKKRKPGRPRLKVHRVRRSGCTVHPFTARALDQWEDQLREIEPKVNPGKILDKLVAITGPTMSQAVVDAVQLAKISKGFDACGND